jgi:hypothetical protein
MPSIQDLKSNLPATGVEELDIGDLTLPHAIICRWIEVVDAPTSDPYGTLVVRFASAPETDVTLTLIQTGWTPPHPAEFVAIGEGTTVTRVRCWK